MNIGKIYSKRGDQGGGVIIEFAVIIPVLIFICFALYDIGQAFAQKAWLESVAYQSVMAGGEVEENRVSKMNEVSDELVDILHIDLEKRFVTPATNTASENITSRTVTSNIPGEIKVASNYFKLPYNISLTGPVLTRDGSLAEALNPVARNQTGATFDCYGTKISLSGGWAGCNCTSNTLGDTLQGCS